MKPSLAELASPAELASSVDLAAAKSAVTETRTCEELTTTPTIGIVLLGAAIA